MDRQAKYMIPFAGLAMGDHQFEYEIDDSFFEAFESSVIERASVHVDLNFHRTETMLTLTFKMDGVIQRVCDRCLGEIEMPVHATRVMLVKFGIPGVGEADDIVVIGHDEQVVDVAQHIYDYLSLMIPMRLIHPDKEDGSPGCDPEFLKKLQDEEEDTSAHPDPRWEVLKNLRLRKN